MRFFDGSTPHNVALKNRIILCFCAFLLLPLFSPELACPPVFARDDSQQKAAGKSPAKPEPDPLYIIQPNDILEIFVYKEPDLTRKVLVRPDGRISFPLVQDLQAAGTNPGELKDQIENRLKEYFSSTPSVTVIVEGIRSYQVFVVGKVQKPGGLMTERPITVLQALAMAGGFQDYAKASEITVIRGSGKESVVFPFDYHEVIKGKKPDQNITLKSGDVVVVP